MSDTTTVISVLLAAIDLAIPAHSGPMLVAGDIGVAALPART